LAGMQDRLSACAYPLLKQAVTTASAIVKRSWLDSGPDFAGTLVVQNFFSDWFGVVHFFFRLG
jgi:hypothetical protein